MATDTNENEPSTPAGTPGGGEGVVLVVDDEAIMRKIAVNILKTEGYNVISATGGEEAIAIFKQRFHEIELVLLDLLMPDQ
ncbi:MAG: response regulator, partial [bacterium]|nr:response regulator [bacterium]